MRRGLKWAVAGVAGVALLGAGGVVALVAAVDAGSLTPRIVAAIEGATGRSVTLGAIALRPGLVPRVTAQDATLGNLPGGTRAEMARIRRLEVQVALLPLLRGAVDIRGITVEGADILLETTPEGPNWVFRPVPRPDAPATATAPGAPAARRSVAVAGLTIADSRVTLPDPRLGTLGVAQARVTGLVGGGPAAVEGEVTLHGVAARLSAETAAMPVLQDTAWRASLAVGANRITADRAAGARSHCARRCPNRPRCARWPRHFCRASRCPRPCRRSRPPSVSGRGWRSRRSNSRPGRLRWMPGCRGWW